MSCAPGDRVVLATPDNPLLDGVHAVVRVPTEWGAHVDTSVGSGRFRALGRSLASVKNRLRQERLRCPRSAALNRWLPALSRPHTIAGLAALFGVKKHAVKQAERRLRRAGHDLPPATRPEGVKT